MSLRSLLLHDPRHPLLFNSGAFFLLFSGAILVLAALGPRRRLKAAFLLLFSLFYYYKCNGVFMLTLVATTALDYLIARRVHRARQERPGDTKAGRGAVVLSVVLNLSVLGAFKYANFALGNAALLFDFAHDPLAIFLPIGISFYTFQSISYVVDVYRGELEPTGSLLEYAFYLSFFPQIVAGPIVRASDLLPQLRALPVPSRDDVSAGLFRILQGLVKKALLADYIGLYSDLVFASPETFSGGEVLLGVYAYAMQIYFDFSGYSDMAIGMARICGVTLPENFRSPYRATSITDFWRRWHITLSTWLRDYLYIALGGNRRGRARRYLHLMVTMLLGGLWHGASWNFVIWGGMHGLALCVHKLVSDARGAPAGEASLPGRAVGWLLTFHLVVVLWVFFRAPDFAAAGTLLSRIVTAFEPAHLVTALGARGWLSLAMLAGALGMFLPLEATLRALQSRFVTAPALAKAALTLLVVQSVAQVQTADVQPFIYFQF